MPYKVMNKEALKARVLVRQNRLNREARKLVVLIEAGRIDREPYTELERQWLDTFAPPGKNGLSLCCGHFSIGDSLGVDTQYKLLGTDYTMSLDDIYKFGPDKFDYVITNHAESTESPVKLFYNIHNILKPSGVFACVFVNSDALDTDVNDICMSPKKLSLFNKRTMEYYLRKAEFKSVEVSDSSTTNLLRAVAIKGE